MIKEPMVSVMIVCYNHEKYIKEAINSVLNQTYSNFELLVLDNNSKDDSVKEIKSIKNKRLKTYFNKTNIGAARAFNQLIKMCKGDYIAVLGSDDIWYENKLKIQMQHFKENIGAVFSLADIIDENGTKIIDSKIFDESIFANDQGKRSKWFRLFYETGNRLCHPTSIIKRSVINKIGEYNIFLRQLHDFDYWIRLINSYEIEVVEQKLMAYRRFCISDQNLSSQTLTNQIRVLNENYFVIENMFINIKDELFREGFSDLFINKNVMDKLDIDCEKFFILKNYKVMGINNKLMAFRMLFNYPNINIFMKKLNSKYNYTLDDFYNEMGTIIENYPNMYYIKSNNELNNIYEIYNKSSKQIIEISNQLETIRNSTSWKITKPFRKLMQILRKK